MPESRVRKVAATTRHVDYLFLMTVSWAYDFGRRGRTVFHEF